MSEVKRCSDAELEQYLADGIAKHQADYDALRAENERLKSGVDAGLVEIVRRVRALKAELAALKAVPDGVEVVAWRIAHPAQNWKVYEQRQDWAYQQYGGIKYEVQDLMTVAQHNAIVAALRQPVADPFVALCAAVTHEMVDAFKVAFHRHDAMAVGYDDSVRIGIAAALRCCQPVADNQQAEREAFEVAYLKATGNRAGTFDEAEVGYVSAEMQRVYSGWLMSRAALSAPAAGQKPTAYLIEGCGTVSLQYKERPTWADGDPTLTVTPLYEGAGQDISALVEALEQIKRWDGFPPTGKTWPESGNPMSYAACYGSNGERDFMRQVAARALARAAHKAGGE